MGDIHMIVETLIERRHVLNQALRRLEHQAPVLRLAASQCIEALESGHKILAAGNGGSAAEAQHFAAEFVGRFKRERDPYAVMALTTDTSILTAIANDYGYQYVFARQVSAFGQPGDVLITFSTSGQSENLLRAALVGRQRGMTIIAATGEHPSPLAEISDISIRVPVVDTALAQELHMMVTHILCDITESQLAMPGSRPRLLAIDPQVKSPSHMTRKKEGSR